VNVLAIGILAAPRRRPRLSVFGHFRRNGHRLLWRISGCAKRAFCSRREGGRRHYVDPKQAVLYVESLFLEKHHGSED